MANLGGPFDLIRNVTCGRDTWRLKVRVVRKWEVCARDNPSNIFSVEMVFVGSEGGRIQASIRKAMLRKYMNSVVEGGVYKMTYFGVVDNGGSFRATSHEFKLLFQARTRVLPAESVMIPRFGLDLKNSKYVKNTKGECDYLIDIIGLVTAIGEEKQYDKGGRTIRVIDLELMDDKGVVKCSLFGHFIDILNGFMLSGSGDCGADLRILVIQFAKVKKFLGVVSIQTMTNSSRLLWNPQIPEAISFKNGIVKHGFDIHLPLGVIGDNERAYTLKEEFITLFLKEEFITLFPRKTIEDLQLTEEEGIFICMGKVEGIIKDGAWWYPSCTCLKAVNFGDDGEGYFCTSCEANVTEVTPSYRLRVEVNDGHEKAHFVLFDSDCERLFSKKCTQMIDELKDPSCYEYPEELYAIMGKELLFKVSLKDDRAYSFDDSFKVQKVCQDEAIINECKEENSVQTPKKSKKKAPFTALSEDGKCDDSQINIVSLDDEVNYPVLSPISLCECSNPGASCLAPEKRKCVARVDDPAVSKKRGRGRPLKIEQ